MKAGGRSVADTLPWHARLRRWLARTLAVLARPDPAAGVVMPDATARIDDGVDYSLPLVLPDWLTGDERAKLISAAIREASSVYHHQFDRPYLYAENMSQFPTADPLREWDYSTRREVLARCHLAYERNPLAKSAIGLTTFFSVGEGFTVTCRNPDVQAVLDEFRANAENAIEQYEKEFCNDLQVDGELFIRFHQDEASGQVVITPIPPWEIDWIETEMGFARRVKVYHQNGQQSSGKPGEVEAIDEEIPAELVLHVTINKHSYHMRGKPELFVILPWLKAYKDWLEGRARQNHWRGALLWDVSLKDASPTQVAAKRAQYRQPPPPGSLAIHNDKETWELKDAKVGAADAGEDGRQIKLMTAVGAKLPEYMLSDGENANLASATAQQLPALRKFVEFQDIQIGQVWKPVYRRVIERAIAAGTLTEEVDEYDSEGEPVTEDVAVETPPKAPEIDPQTGFPKPQPEALKGPPQKIKAVDAFDVVGPEIETTDPKTLAEAMQIITTNDWASPETASQKLGFDYYVEQKKIEKHLRRKQQRMAQGLEPGAFPVDLAGFQGDDPAGQRGAGDGGKPARESEPVEPPVIVEAAPTPPAPVTIVNVLGERANGHAPENADDVATHLRRIISDQVQEAERQAQAAANERTDALGVELGAVRQEVRATAGALNQRLDSLAVEAHRRETDTLAAFRQVMDALEEASEPATLTVDEALVRRIASEVAQTAVAEVEPVGQDVIATDEAGRATRLRRRYASGRFVDYDVIRNADMSIAALQRVQGE